MRRGKPKIQKGENKTTHYTDLGIIDTDFQNTGQRTEDISERENFTRRFIFLFEIKKIFLMYMNVLPGAQEARGGYEMP